MAEAKIAVSVDVRGLKATEALHKAVFVAVAKLNGPEAADFPLTTMRIVRDILQIALAGYADAFRDRKPDGG